MPQGGESSGVVYVEWISSITLGQRRNFKDRNASGQRSNRERESDLVCEEVHQGLGGRRREVAHRQLRHRRRPRAPLLPNASAGPPSMAALPASMGALFTCMQHCQHARCCHACKSERESERASVRESETCWRDWRRGSRGGSRATSTRWIHAGCGGASGAAYCTATRSTRPLGDKRRPYPGSGDRRRPGDTRRP
eukprot:2927702-Rhodomonas_salina.3